MTLGQRFCQDLFLWAINCWCFVVILFFIAIVISNIYDSFYRVNRETYNIDLMERYLWLQMRKKYGRPKV